MRREEPVKYGTAREIVLFNYENVGTILGRFLEWDVNTSPKIEITYNSVERFEIIRIDHILKSTCYDEEINCNELQIKGKSAASSNTGTFTIGGNKNCDFKDTDAVYVKFTVSELNDNLHERLLCSECFRDELTPDVKKGNILQGGD